MHYISKKRKCSDFKERVHRVVKNIRPGSTLTYGEVAIEAGFPGAARAVGTLLSKNFDDTIPCHRVIRADGKMGGYNRGGEITKRVLLFQERALQDMSNTK